MIISFFHSPSLLLLTLRIKSPVAPSEGLLQRASLPIKAIGRFRTYLMQMIRLSALRYALFAFPDGGIKIAPHIFAKWHHFDA